jgi:hypothetical protein
MKVLKIAMFLMFCMAFCGCEGDKPTTWMEIISLGVSICAALASAVSLYFAGRSATAAETSANAAKETAQIEKDWLERNVNISQNYVEPSGHEVPIGGLGFKISNPHRSLVWVEELRVCFGDVVYAKSDQADGCLTILRGGGSARGALGRRIEMRSLAFHNPPFLLQPEDQIEGLFHLDAILPLFLESLGEISEFAPVIEARIRHREGWVKGAAQTLNLRELAKALEEYEATREELQRSDLAKELAKELKGAKSGSAISERLEQVMEEHGADVGALVVRALNAAKAEPEEAAMTGSESIAEYLGSRNRSSNE